MASQKQLLRIQEMEACLDRSAAAFTELERALDALEKVQADYHRLCDYYDSALWRKDFADDEAGRLPPQLKRGVLSEDAVYDLITQRRALERRLLRLLSPAPDGDTL